MSFDFVCCSVAQEMNFVDCCLPYFRQHLITHPVSGLLPFQSLSTESLSGDELLVPPPFSGALRSPCPSAMCSFSVLCLLFTFFLQGGGQSVQGTMVVYPRGTVGIPHASYLLICWLHLPSRFGTLLFSQCNMMWRSFV
jgi:hypothetical protein